MSIEVDRVIYRNSILWRCTAVHLYIFSCNEINVLITTLSWTLIICICILHIIVGIFRSNSCFIGANCRDAVNSGRGDCVPVFLGEIPGLFRKGYLPLDVALVSVTPPDKHGYCSLGSSVDTTRAATQVAKHIIGKPRDFLNTDPDHVYTFTFKHRGKILHSSVQHDFGVLILHFRLGSRYLYNP